MPTITWGKDKIKNKTEASNKKQIKSVRLKIQRYSTTLTQYLI